MGDQGFPQPRLTRSELRDKLHSIIDSMVDRLPLAEDREAQLVGYVDLTKLVVEQSRGFERPGDEIELTLHSTLKIEIFPEHRTKETT
jgi:hypothetical protein